MTVGRLLREITSVELTEWMVYENMAGPLGPRRGDYHAAQITATLQNVNRGRGRKARGVDEVLLRWDAAEPLTAEEIYTRVRQINTALGGTVTTGTDTTG